VTLDILSETKSHGGRQLVVRHASASTSTDMIFSIFLPPQAEGGDRLPVVWYLSGLTCSHSNVTEKGEYRAACAELGLVFVAPDTSPRGEDVPDAEGYDFGKGAGFYVDSTIEPWSMITTPSWLRNGPEKRGVAPGLSRQGQGDDQHDEEGQAVGQRFKKPSEAQC